MLLQKPNHSSIKVNLSTKWRPGVCVAVWLCGRVAVWPCGCVAVWPCGCVAMWLCGRVSVCLCGCVSVCLCGCVYGCFSCQLAAGPVVGAVPVVGVVVGFVEELSTSTIMPPNTTRQALQSSSWPGHLTPPPPLLYICPPAKAQP